MSKRVRTAFCAMLLGLTSCRGLQYESRGDHGGAGPGGPPLSTIHAEVFKLIVVDGDIPQAIEYYKLAVGVEQAPRWLLLMQSAFAAANRVAGPCRDVADKISEAFKQLGENPQIVRIAATRGPLLSWQGRILMSNNNFHVAVMNSGRLYDAFTGPQGMLWAAYRQAVQCNAMQWCPSVYSAPMSSITPPAEWKGRFVSTLDVLVFVRGQILTGIMPEMFIGRLDVRALAAFVHGISFHLYCCDAPDEGYMEFIDWLRDVKQEFPSPEGWDGLYLADFKGDHRAAIMKFLDRCAEFIALRRVS